MRRPGRPKGSRSRYVVSESRRRAVHRDPREKDAIFKRGGYDGPTEDPDAKRIASYRERFFASMHDFIESLDSSPLTPAR